MPIDSLTKRCPPSAVDRPAIRFPIDGKKIKAARFYKTTSKDDTNTFEIWFSEGKNFPIRSVIGLSEQYGATIQVDLKKLPNL